jgi:hypothetical protein
LKIKKIYFLTIISIWSLPIIAGPPNMEDLKIHNTKSDCWIEIENEFYDITQYLAEHQKRFEYDLTEWCGKASTLGWQTKDLKKKKHSRKAGRILKRYKIPK